MKIKLIYLRDDGNVCTTERENTTKTKEDTTMTKNTAMKAQELRLAATTTPEDLDGRFSYGSGKMVTFGKLSIVAGYFFRGNEDSFYWAVYRNEGGIEDATNLEAVSEGFFEDDGHALADAFGWVAQRA